MANRIKKSLVFRFWDKFDRPKDECWLWKAGKSSGGYGNIDRGDGCGYSSIRAHRLSWMLYNGPIPNGLCILHKCDNPACVNPDHLFLGTKGDNAKDRDAKGRLVVCRGEKHWKSKLTVLQVKQIKQLGQQGMRTRDIAKRFPVTQRHIGRIIKGLFWKHV